VVATARTVADGIAARVPVLETAAAAGWAAAQRHATPEPIGFVLTGGNVSPPA
jgi:hypothetical protein